MTEDKTKLKKTFAKKKQDKNVGTEKTKLGSKKLTDTPSKPYHSEASWFFGKKRLVGYGAVAALVVTVLAYLGSQLFAATFLSFGAVLFGKDAVQVFDDLETSAPIQTIYIGLVAVITLYIIWVFMKGRSVSLGDIGLGRKPKWLDLNAALVTFVIYFTVLILVTAFITAVVPSIDTEQQQQLGFKNATATRDLILVFISLVILPPIIEEIMVRGFLYTGLKTKFTKVWAAITASVIFGIAHLQLGSGAPPLWIAAVDTTILSLFLIYLRERTGSLWSGMIVHAMKNGLAFLVLFVFKIV